MPGSCDLHVHSTASDGALGPGALVEEARSRGIRLLALTDHDSLAGIPEARARARELGIELLPGIEVSVSEDGGRRTMHILGLGIDAENPGLRRGVELFREDRRNRVVRMLALLARSGIPLRLEQVESIADGASLGRPHVARALVQAGFCASSQEAFDRFLRRGRPAHASREGPDARTAIALIHAAGGIAALAHPPLSGGVDAPGGLDRLVADLVRLGLDGLEVHHPRHAPPMRRRLRRLARKHGLVSTGGSDFHDGARSGAGLGCGFRGPPGEREIREALARRLGRQRTA